MQEQLPLTNAAIDIGSNTIHIVVANYCLEGLTILKDEQEIVRIGESVTETGEISLQKCVAAVSTLRHYQSLAYGYGAKRIFVVATEAIHHAHNNVFFLERVQSETGLQVHLISGLAEATLTFLGATYEISTHENPPVQLGVMDLGGGSMELVISKERQILARSTMPIGSGWLHDKYLLSNLPTYYELVMAQNFLRNSFHEVQMKYQIKALICTGGSASGLLLLAHRAFNLDEKSNQLTIENLLRCESLLKTLTAEEISQYYGLPPPRARILLAGLMIILSVIEHLDLNKIQVSHHGIREGILLVYKSYGEYWLERVSEDSLPG